MRKETFNELLQSVRDLGAFFRGDLAPAEILYFTNADIKEISIEKKQGYYDKYLVEDDEDDKREREMIKRVMVNEK